MRLSSGGAALAARAIDPEGQVLVDARAVGVTERAHVNPKTIRQEAITAEPRAPIPMVIAVAHAFVAGSLRGAARAAPRLGERHDCTSHPPQSPYALNSARRNVAVQPAQRVTTERAGSFLANVGDTTKTGCAQPATEQVGAGRRVVVDMRRM